MSRTTKPDTRHRLVTGRSEAIVERIVAELAAPTADPLAKRVIVVPNHLIGTHVRRQVARVAGAVANLRAMTIEHLADDLARPAARASGKAPLGALARRIVIADVLKSTTLRHLKALSGQEGFVQAVAALVDDLEEAGYEKFPAAASGDVHVPKAADLARIYNAFRDAISRERYTALEVFAWAEAAAPQAATLFGAGALSIFGFSDLNRAQRRLVRAVAEHVPLIFYVSYAEDAAHEFAKSLVEFVGGLGASHESIAGAEADATLAIVRRRLFDDRTDPAPAAAPDGSIAVISAPDEIREARAVLARILDARREGVPFEEIAVVYAGANEKELLAGELSSSLVPREISGQGSDRIPLYVDGGLPAAGADTAGLALVKLAQVAADGLPREAVIELVSLAPNDQDRQTDSSEDWNGVDDGTDSGTGMGTLNPQSSILHPHLWDLVSREAGIVEGARAWRRAPDTPALSGSAARYNLARYEMNCAAKLAENPRDRRIAERRAAAAQLLARVEPLVRFFDAVHGDDLAAAFNALAVAARAYAPASETLSTFLAQIEALAGDDLVVRSLSPAEIPNIAAVIARGLSVKRGRYGHGVALLPIHRARHLRFARVIVTGAIEGRIPGAGRQDALLTDDERRAVDERSGEPNRLPLLGERYAEEMHRFALALTCARESVTIAYPRADRANGRLHTPSAFVDAVLEAATGRVGAMAAGDLPPGLFARIGENDLHAIAASVEDTERASIVAAIRRGDAGVRDRLLTLPAWTRPFLARMRARAEARASRVLTAYDGIVGGVAPDGARPFSASALETYAQCPRKYFLSRVIGLETLPEPETQFRLDPQQRGALVHHALAAAFATARDAGLFPLTEAGAAHLRVIFEAALKDRAEAMFDAGEIGDDTFLRADIAAIARDFREQLRREIEPGDMRPAHFEIEFGDDDPLTLELPDGRALRLAGRIDRVDENGHELRVIDYKGSKMPAAKKKDGGVFFGGEALQLAFYLFAAAKRFPEKRAVDAAYFHNSRRGGFARVPLAAETLDARRGDLGAIVAAIVDGIAAGHFPPNADARLVERPCRFCEFAYYCGTENDVRARDEKTGPARERFSALKEIE
ncbi:PD-(D/E)XK nuclease family protein [bacterium]|nr:PD-(D/E)XK nuclease family protein [bacterium]